MSGVLVTVDSIHLPTVIVDTLYNHAQVSPEKEICGLLAVRDGVVANPYPINNVADEACHRFEMDPRQLIDAFRNMRQQGEELFAIYHSHPNGSAQPSERDISRHQYPQAYCLIIFLQGQGSFALGAYRMINGVFVQVDIEVGAP
ncbi:MAG: M67 family metallopeptidase [Gammaproteobacteria bacterium]|nr:M67 family metallopeptidase [Gammaproteobacteria bacterium]